MGDEVLVSVPFAIWILGASGFVCWNFDSGKSAGLCGTFWNACLLTMLLSMAVRGEMQRGGLVGLVAAVAMLREEEDGARGGERMVHLLGVDCGLLSCPPRILSMKPICEV